MKASRLDAPLGRPRTTLAFEHDAAKQDQHHPEVCAHNDQYEMLFVHTITRPLRPYAPSGEHSCPSSVHRGVSTSHELEIPRWAASIPTDITHLGADAYRNPGQLPSGRVLVVGGGGSGRQIALELTRSHEVSLSVGARILITPQRVLGRDVMVWFDRLGFLRADKGTARGRFAKAHESFPGPHLRDSALRRHGVHLRPRTTAVTSEGFAFADGSRAAFDAVIWAGGYEDRAVDL